ncbi:hypothetical protein ILUMI_14290 [Ignelater luminosus]|uniref:Uncharacterized protein n=1 Tax=Ignelater luminosus TaxID=2038154 RepID=A0A8K0GA40_IGNLU|nr:hypothetical protein ILUMI_14290 [Ignelater luminosus]
MLSWLVLLVTALLFYAPSSSSIVEDYETAKKTCANKPNEQSCIWTTVGLQEKNGAINYINLTKYYAKKYDLSENVTKAILKFCQSIQGFPAEIMVGKVDRCFGVEKYRYSVEHPGA